MLFNIIEFLDRLFEGMHGKNLEISAAAAASIGLLALASVALNYKNVLSVKLPSSLAAGTYSVLLSVRDAAGNADTFTWHVTVLRHR